MLFNSVLFMVWFLPILLVVYHFIDGKKKNGLILGASIFFYAWGGPLFILAILCTTLADFYLVRWMDEEENPRRRLLKLWLPLALNLGMLAFFKYSNFFVDNLNWMLKQFGMEAFGWTRIVLPLGISFYTFESITYAVDVYRRVNPGLKRFQDYLFYILFFPKLLVGPIVRYHEFAPQIKQRSESAELRLTGFYRIATGLGKKVLIAESLSSTVQFVFEYDPALLPASWAAMGIIAYSLYVYFDFSGYTDIALGIAQMLGFKLPENFNNPYLSRSITEFWTRWHMSLSRFMRDYLYIPLGGNRKGKYRTLANLLIVFLVSGLWHGASWACVLWGGLYGLVMLIERAFLGKWLEKLPGILSMLYTFVLFSLINVFFWPGPVEHALSILGALTNFNHLSFPVEFSREFFIGFVFALLFAYWAALPRLRTLQEKWYGVEHSPRGYVTLTLISLCLFFLCLGFTAWSPVHPFTYLRF